MHESGGSPEDSPRANLFVEAQVSAVNPSPNPEDQASSSDASPSGVFLSRFCSFQPPPRLKTRLTAGGSSRALCGPLSTTVRRPSEFPNVQVRQPIAKQV